MEILSPPVELAKQQVETLKPPKELPKLPAAGGTPGAAKLPCPPGADKTAEQCDTNVPGAACPTPKDLENRDKFIGKIVDPQHTLTMFKGRTRLLRLNEVPRRVQVGDEKIANFTIIDDKQIVLLAKELGDTVLNLWFPNPADPADNTKDIVISYLVRVVPDPDLRATLEARYKKLADAINAAFPDSRICLFLVGDKLVVQGYAKDVAEAAQILRIARSEAPRVDDKTPYNVTLTVDPATTGRDRFRDLLDAAGPYVINLLRIPGEQQVYLKVTVAEINRAALRSIGVNFVVRNSNGVPVFSQLTGNIAGTNLALGQSGLQGAGLAGVGTLNGLSQSANNLPTIIDNGRVVLAIDALRNLQYARTLAEPGILALDGQTGTFQAGGEFPVPVVTGQTFVGLQGVQFIPFGVQLSFTPTIADRDRVRLALNGVVSTRDLSAAATINGTNVPGLTTRNFQTTVELRHGQTFAIAGLIQNNLGAQSNRVPFFGDLPVIGHLFGFDQIEAGEQELVILVTPVLMHPLNNDELTPLPGSDLFEPGDLEFYLCNRLESRRAYDYRSPVRTDIHRMLRYHRCEEIYITGPSGHSEAAPSQPSSSK
jgi:pilus assembly protein CpaC